MEIEGIKSITIEKHHIQSKHLNRPVTIDVYVPPFIAEEALSLLLINDGQNLHEMHFDAILEGLLQSGSVQPLLCVGIHASENRRDEYGTAKVLDYEGRGKTAGAYQQFLVNELLPHLHTLYHIDAFKNKAVAGFSMGGLSALDTVWNHPEIFSIAGVFSGSLWWRTKSLEADYIEERDRIMHQQIKQGTFLPHLKFYFTTGSQDETADRNGNGIIDSIDDTLALIAALEDLGYNAENGIRYINYEDGRHDVATWGRAMPQFLLWGWSRTY